MKSQFIGEQIQAEFDTPPMLSKKPGCPDGFIWRGSQYAIEELLHEWVDYGRRGRSADNMQPAHAALALQKGSWGVGRYYFRVRSHEGRIFELYYDRAPKDVDHRKGSWFLTREYFPQGA